MSAKSMIQFTCEHCGRRIKAADSCAGRQGRCPQCKQAVRVPPLDAAPPASSRGPADGTALPGPRPPSDGDFLNLSHKPLEAEAGRSGHTASEVRAEAEDETGREVVAEAPAHFTDVFVYPANLNGFVQIVVLAVCLWITALLGDLLGSVARPYGGLLGLVGRVMAVGYTVFYVGYCVYDSSQGGRRAATISPAHAPDFGELVSQLLLLVGGVAVCFWPAAVYRGVTGRGDAWFYILGATGAFFLPMALLTATLFDGIDALNPLLIVRSILVTFPSYAVLLLQLGLLAGILLGIYWTLGQIPLPRVLSMVVYLYFLLMGAHLLGRFYWRGREKLGWGL